MNLDREMSRYLVLDEESIRVALQKIDHNDEGVVVCVDTTGLLLGILTDGDLRRWLFAEDRYHFRRRHPFDQAQLCYLW